MYVVIGHEIIEKTKIERMSLNEVKLTMTKLLKTRLDRDLGNGEVSKDDKEEVKRLMDGLEIEGKKEDSEEGGSRWRRSC